MTIRTYRVRVQMPSNVVAEFTLYNESDAVYIFEAFENWSREKDCPPPALVRETEEVLRWV